MLIRSLVLLLQEHAERPHVVQQLIADAHMLVQSAQQLEVRLDKDVAKLQVASSWCCLLALHSYHLMVLLAVVTMLLACYNYQLAKVADWSKGPGKMLSFCALVTVTL